MQQTYFPESVSLDSAAYDEETRELTIQLRTGRTYVYRDVPDVEYDRLVSAESAGRYYNLRIRDDYAFSEIVPYEALPDRSRRALPNPPSRRRVEWSRVSRARRMQARRSRRG